MKYTVVIPLRCEGCGAPPAPCDSTADPWRYECGTVCNGRRTAECLERENVVLTRLAKEKR